MEKNAAFSRLSGKALSRAGRLPRALFRILLYLFLIMVAFVFLYPFLRMLVTSVKSYGDLHDMNVNWIPTAFELKNYRVAAHYLDIPIHLMNSLFIAVACTLGHVLACSYIAYGFARFRFKGRGFLFVVVVFTIILPPQVLILPQYMQYMNLGFLNSYLPIVLPTFFGYGLRGGLYIFIFRQFFLSLPAEIEDAAQVDGYGYMRIYLKIALPMVRTAILMCVLVSVVWHWNDYFEPSIYLSLTEKLPLPAMLPDLFGGVRDIYQAILENKLDILVTDGVVMAAITICITPLILLFAVLQKGFVQGVERSGLVE